MDFTHLLEMVSVMMKLTLQSVTLMVGIAVSIQMMNFALIVAAFAKILSYLEMGSAIMKQTMLSVFMILENAVDLIYPVSNMAKSLWPLCRTKVTHAYVLL